SGYDGARRWVMSGHDHDHDHGSHGHSHGSHDHGAHGHDHDSRDHDHGAHGHDHGHGHHGHSHHAPPDRLTRAFVVGIMLNVAFVAGGVIAGIAAHSTALLADAAHNFGDVLGLAMAWGATVLARRARTARRTYGLRRTTILAALANGGLVLFAIGGVVWEALHRLGAPPPGGGGPLAGGRALGRGLNRGAATPVGE